MKRQLTGKILYAVLFCFAFPLLLIWWSSSLSVNLPILPWKLTAFALSFVGFVLIFEAMWQLWKNGKGLPMNAYPPQKYVTTGSYKLFFHPIYVGFCILCAGVSLMNQSASGFYVVTPVVMILCAALVFGYEGPDLKKRFGPRSHHTLFALSEKTDSPITFRTRLAIFFSAFVPWLILYELLIHVGTDTYYVDTRISWEMALPVVEIAEIPYAVGYLFVCLTPFIIKTEKQRRKFLSNAWWITGCGIFLQFLFPFYTTHKPFEPTTFLGDLILIERRYDGIAAAFPSFHVMWTLLALTLWSESFPKWKIVWWAISILIALSCLGTGIHSIADVIGAVIVFLLIAYRQQIWIRIQRTCEHLANSWRAWHVGGLRIINHSLYAGIAAAAGVSIVHLFSVDNLIILIVVFSSLVGGALWAQFIEGSSRLQRPFGYYGAMLGGIAGLVITQLFSSSTFIITVSAFALAAPWTQALGRLRCLVQGCCHGRADEHAIGIKYYNDHSRVCGISGLKGVNIHNTQLYSIVSNVLIGLILLRLWYGHASPSLITGIYFILSGAARFVEEAYRGEVQTKIIKGLSLYQWMAIVSILAGIFLSTIQATERVALNTTFGLTSWIVILVAGISWAFAMGMDFPKSTKRFSRLTG